PNVSGTPTELGDVGPGLFWFDTSVFSAAPPDTWGNAARNGVLDGPKYVNLDTTIAKLFSFPHGIRADFRADIFNLLNRLHFDRPSGNCASPNFRQITGIIDVNGGLPDQRSMRFGLRILF